MSRETDERPAGRIHGWMSGEINGRPVAWTDG